MKNISQIYLLLSFLMYTILSAIVYMIAKDIINNIQDKKVNKLKDTFGKDIIKQLENIKAGNKLSKMDISYVEQKLGKRLYIRAFNHVIMEFNKENSNHEYTKMYMKNFEDIVLKQIKKSSRRDTTMKIHQSYLLAEYKLSNFEINEFLFNSLSSESTNLRVAALNAISQIGNEEKFIKAIKYLSDNDKYINTKILCDIIDDFDGDKSSLDKELIKVFDLLSDDTKRTVIHHFRNKETTLIEEKMLEVLKDNSSNKEVKIGAIKYFSKVKYDLALDELIRISKYNDWEYRAVCATTLGNYNVDSSKKCLLKSIGDKNWYVRHNSALSLLKFEDDDVIEEVLSKNDKYSKDILIYSMHMRNSTKDRYYLDNIDKGVADAC